MEGKFTTRPRWQKGKVGIAIHAFLHPDAVGIDDGLIFIAEDGEGEGVFLDELFVALHAVDAHAKDLRLGTDVRPAIAQGAGLLGAARRIVLWVKVENNGFALQVAEFDFRPRGVVTADDGSVKGGGFGTGSECGGHAGENGSGIRRDAKKTGQSAARWPTGGADPAVLPAFSAHFPRLPGTLTVAHRGRRV